MAMADEVTHRRDDFAWRFLQTAVVVDDEAYIPSAGGDRPEPGLVAPDRRRAASSPDSQGTVSRGAIHTLNAGTVMDAFSALGIICGVVGPTDAAKETIRRADIVVLDWLLRNDEPQYALELIRGLLTEEADRNSLRLVAIYTGESGVEDISAAVSEELRAARLDPVVDDSRTTISYRHGSVVLYVKSDVNLAERLKSRSIAEEALPERLVEDFAAMTGGLLPGIALTSLTAVREGEHRVLDQFGADLDPAFLAHRACLADPDDAERQIVNHVADELRGLMDNAVAEASPASAEAVERWIRREDGGSTSFVFGKNNLDLEQTVKLANGGLAASELSEKAFDGLAAGFAGRDVLELDERLAWVMSFRTVYNAPPPALWLGTVVTESPREARNHLICIRPRCDCVRLKGETGFYFVPLVEPRKELEQIVVKLGETFRRLGIDFDQGGWVRREFRPSGDNDVVRAKRRESDGGFEFIDVGDNRYTWRGELKAEYAQRIAQTLAGTLSRVAVDESEWLRRIARRGQPSSAGKAPGARDRGDGPKAG